MDKHFRGHGLAEGKLDINSPTLLSVASNGWLVLVESDLDQ